jgi:hypothetical protein
MFFLFRLRLKRNKYVQATVSRFLAMFHYYKFCFFMVQFVIKSPFHTNNDGGTKSDLMNNLGTIATMMSSMCGSLRLVAPSL